MENDGYNPKTVNECFKFNMPSRSAICHIIRDSKLCRAKISNNHQGNKIRHLQKMHSDIYAHIIREKKRNRTSNTGERITVDLSIEKIYLSFVELVSKNGRPFCICNDSGLRIIIDPILKAIEESTGEKFAINHLVIKEKVAQVYIYIRNRIRAEVKNKPVSLMTDISTKHNHAILGINIRYPIEATTIVSRTIGMVPLKNSHTAEYIHQSIRSCLNEYEIKPNQIISSTTDNAQNIVNVTDFFNNDCDEYLTDGAFYLDDKMFELLNESFFEHLLENVQPILETEYPYVVSIACGAHTNQLAVNDSLKIEAFHGEIEFVKGIVKQLRTPTMSAELRKRNLKQAKIDHDIRWNYTYLMVLFYLDFNFASSFHINILNLNFSSKDFLS